MASEYLIVHKTALPDYFIKIIEIKELLEKGKVDYISEAVRIVGISRSTYYKYKDLIFESRDEIINVRTAIFSLILNHQVGVLSLVLNKISYLQGNVLTIMQNPPIGKRASVVLSIDIHKVKEDINGIISSLMEVEGVIKVELLDLE